MHALQLVSALVDDLKQLEGPGIGWSADREKPPATIAVQVADLPASTLRLGGTGAVASVEFAARLQDALTGLTGTVPPCPVHAHALVPVVADPPRWSCPEGGWSCAFGRYHESRWPPGPEVARGTVQVILAQRFRRRGVRGVQGFGADLRDGAWVVHAGVYEGDPQRVRAVRNAAAPVPVDIEILPAETTTRIDAGNSRTLQYSGMIMGASLTGTVHRAPQSGRCDLLVDQCRVRLIADHRVGPRDGAVLLDADGVPFAYEGDAAVLSGGFVPDSDPHLPGLESVFLAGVITVHTP